MNDMTQVIIPRSDQINSDDLLSGPMTITIREVQIKGGQEQPVSIYFDGSDKAFRPCKSMSRVLVAAWGPDAKAYVGRSLTLYRDPTVKWGGLEVGGIRISHMTDIDSAMTMALTATKGSRKPYTVKPLSAAPADAGLAAARQAIANAPTLDALKVVWSSRAMAPFRDKLQGDLDDRKAALAFEPEGPAEQDRGESFTDTDLRRTNAEAFVATYTADIAKAGSLEDLEQVHARADDAAARIRRDQPELYAEKLSGLRPADAPEKAVDPLFEGQG